MIDKYTGPEDEFHRAQTRRRYFSSIWLIPIIAGLIASYLGVRSYIEHGPFITITMESAEGLVPGQTLVKYKGVSLGIVEDITLKSDHSGVSLHTRMTAQAKSLLTKSARFWLVRPRLNTNSISDIQSLVSGTYIQMDPGKPEGSLQTSFAALDKPPAMPVDQPGTIYTLLAERLGPLGIGSAVYYRDMNVGEVREVDIGNGFEAIKVKIFVRAPYDKFVYPNSRFWNDSGLSVAMGPGGFHVELQSLPSLLSGAIAFETTEGPDKKPERSAAATAFFPLYGSREMAEIASYTKHIPCVTYLHASIKDLAAGSPVEIYGVMAGTVTDVRLVLDAQDNKPKIRVAFDIQPDLAFGTNSENSSTYSMQTLLHLVQEGMRVKLESKNLVLGQEILSLEYEPQAVTAQPVKEGDTMVLPGGGDGDLTSALSDVAGKLSQIPFEDIGHHLDHLLATVDQTIASPQMQQAVRALEATLANARDISQTAKTDLTPSMQRLPEISLQLQGAVTHANELLNSVNAGFGQDSDFNRTVKHAMDEVNDAARSIRLLADFLNHHPEALLQGKSSTTHTSTEGKP